MDKKRTFAASLTDTNARDSYLWGPTSFSGKKKIMTEEKMNEMLSILDLSGIELGIYYLPFRT
ncbi:hypothetical protein [Tetragenococcus koreensis]|uniref:Uncharacterized protein n=1 Tax=Tetragenococcus koreensis TaxID=290335 RepID=A0AAN4RK86_9ENTE|nr:hypothetical protein [Tetragenococcus koreensis]AYW46552.1 hypothetical protein C7K43_11815 [Tetragenococcus koreensis]MCF1617512.1 hypothetical protein [Tetragenococcus koreensis]MCF1622271.1 hypothetical protein [Tetragenococcus koreensis]MCF1627171.1 hypothetical protein [Tetragenococcus koreensis]MCF1632706.1 hypothetical protein [Tetragenococcus koreensis]